MMFPGLCFAARLSKFIFPVAEVELREGKVPHRNYKTQELGMSKIVLNTINIEYNIVLNTINELKCHPNQGCNCAMPTLQENPGNCCSPDLFQALWAKGWVFVTQLEDLDLLDLCQNVPNSATRSPKSPPGTTCAVPSALAGLGEGTESKASHERLIFHQERST